MPEMQGEFAAKARKRLQVKGLKVGASERLAQSAEVGLHDDPKGARSSRLFSGQGKTKGATTG